MSTPGSETSQQPWKTGPPRPTSYTTSEMQRLEVIAARQEFVSWYLKLLRENPLAADSVYKDYRRWELQPIKTVAELDELIHRAKELLMI